MAVTCLSSIANDPEDLELSACATFCQLLLGQIHGLPILIFQQADYRFALFKHRRSLRFPEARRIAPQLFQSIKSPLFLIENVDDHIRIIHDDPLTDGRTF